MPSGTSINLFLVEGSPTGLVTAGIGQWTGQATVVPKAKVAKFSKRDEAQRPGVYVLVGPDPSREDRERVYVGEGELVLDRLKLHVREKDFWTRACVFTSSDGRLTKAHVKYLESRLIQVAEERGRAAMENGKASTLPALPEADRSDMDHFVERVLVLLPVLGFDFSRPRAEVLAAEADSTHPTFTYALPSKGATARAREVDGEFIVLKGSTASAKPANSWDTYQDLHKEMLADGVLVQDPDNADLYTFSRDYTFKSPSAAGSIVAASNVSGPAVWCVEGSAQPYRDWQDAKIEQSEAEASPQEQPEGEAQEV
ncbi:MAG: GIY-YIG nuclease family protein [Acidobacteriota bacterium]